MWATRKVSETSNMVRKEQEIVEVAYVYSLLLFPMFLYILLYLYFLLLC